MGVILAGRGRCAEWPAKPSQRKRGLRVLACVTLLGLLGAAQKPGEETAKAAAELDTDVAVEGGGADMKGDAGGGNDGARNAMKETASTAQPNGASSEQSPPKETHSSSDSDPKIGIVEELPAPKDGVVYVLDTAGILTWSKPLILGNLTVEHYTTINEAKKGHVRAGVPKIHKKTIDTIKLSERYRQVLGSFAVGAGHHEALDRGASSSRRFASDEQRW